MCARVCVRVCACACVCVCDEEWVNYHLPTTTMELHVSTPIAGSPALDPACLAAVWACQESKLDITIMPSGNHHLSPTQTLPVLLVPDAEPVAGFIEIAARVLQHNYDPVELALLAYMQQLSVISQWVLFVVPENYESLTRPEISAAVPFPMQYNAALSLQRIAQASQPRKNQTVSKPPTEAVNKLHADMLKQNEIRWKARDTPQQTMSRVSQFSEIVDTVLPLLEPFPENSPARLFLAANLVLVSLNRLPVRPLAAIIDQRQELAELRDKGLARNYQLSKLESDIPADRAYSLMNTLRVYKQYILG